MKLLEIKNNLVKLSYEADENPILGKFAVIVSNAKSYVVQFVNLKSDKTNNFAIAKLLFTFTQDGVVDNYDGSAPDINSEVSFLPVNELLELLPVETPVKLGNIAQQEDLLSLDISVFEHNFTVFAERDIDKSTFISNCVRQLFQMKEKSVVVDTANLFEDYAKIVFTKDFKLPLNSEMIDYIFEVELSEVDTSTKAVIQNIFYAVQQYVKTLEFEFLPIDNFVEVVANQYKETQMPELALLKNKLLKYKDANVFANTKEEILAFNKKLSEKNCSIIDLKNINEPLQKKVLMFIHKSLETVQKYIYLFVPLTDENSDKKLLKQFINNNHIFTAFLTSNSYKYAQELKSHAENMMIFTPQTLQHDFAAYNTFLNKLNPGECIVVGRLTNEIPFIIEVSDLELDLTKDDVFGDKYNFAPAVENINPVSDSTAEDGFDEIFGEDEVQPIITEQANITEKQETDNIFDISRDVDQIPTDEISLPEDNQNTDYSEVVGTDDKLKQEKPMQQYSEVIEPVENILEDNDDGIVEENYRDDIINPQELREDDLDADEVLTDDDLNFMEHNGIDAAESTIDIESEDEDDLSIDEPLYTETSYEAEQSPVVPVYPADEKNITDSGVGQTEFMQGDSISHPRYGRGVVEKIIKYGNKTLCSISFDNVGRRLLDPSISEFVKL